MHIKLTKKEIGPYEILGKSNNLIESANPLL
jgi:hypothetical protein